MIYVIIRKITLLGLLIPPIISTSCDHSPPEFYYAGDYSSIALDGSGRPHISYQGGNALKYAYWTGSSWNIQTVDTGDSNGKINGEGHYLYDP